MTLDGQVLLDVDAPGAVDLGAGLVGDHLAERGGGDSGGPDLGHGLDATDRAVLVLDLDAGAVDLGDHGAELDLDAALLEAGAGLAAEAVTEGGQHLRRSVEQDDAGVPRVDVAELVRERLVRQLGDLAGHLDTRRARADDDEGEQPLAVLGVGRRLGELEGTEDAPPQLERVVDVLHARRVAGEVVVAEVRLAGAGGDDEAVVGRDGRLVQRVRGDGAALDVDLGDVAEDGAHVLVAGEDVAGRRGDVALGEDARRHLVQQRLEEVVAGPRDEGDLDVLAAQGLRGEEAAEAGSDDDDAVLARVSAHVSHCGPVCVEGEIVSVSLARTSPICYRTSAPSALAPRTTAQAGTRWEASAARASSATTMLHGPVIPCVMTGS